MYWNNRTSRPIIHRIIYAVDLDYCSQNYPYPVVSHYITPMFCRSYEWNPKLIVVEGKLNPVTRLLPGSVIGTDTEVVMVKVENTVA